MNQESWLEFGGNSGETEETILGNRAGLLLLREAIDGALRTGDAEIDVIGSLFVRVRCLQNRATLVPPTSTSADKTVSFLGLLIGMVLLFLIFLGLRTFISWF